MNILFLIDQFEPICDAQSFVLNNIISSTAFSSDKIYIIAHERFPKTADIQQNVRTNIRQIIYFVDFYTLDYANLKEYLKGEDPAKRPFLWLSYFIKRIVKSIYSWFVGPACTLSSHRFYKKACKLMKNEKMDLIMPISGNFGCQKAAETIYKKTGVPFAGYYLDPMYTFPGYKNKNRIKNQEKKWIDASLTTFMPPLLKPDYEPISKNITYVNYPSSFKFDYTNINICGEPRIFLFCGSFLKNIREPKPLFAFAEMFPKDRFLCLCNKNKSLKESENTNVPKNIEFVGPKILPQMIELIAKANFLINIENEVGNQVPSKVYLYLFSKKPIINFKSEFTPLPADVNPLISYPEILNLPKQSCYEQEALKIRDFVNKNKTNNINDEDLNQFLDYSNEKICETIRIKLSSLIGKN